jgi:bifunctional isochorismate lyase/aryl carrier protein
MGVSLKMRYFTEDSIEQKSRAMINGVRHLVSGRAQEFKPGQSVLLVLDMQRYFLDESSHAFVPSATSIVPRLKGLANAYARHGRPVVFTRHMNTTNDAGMLSKWWSDVIVKDHPASEITPEFDLSRITVLGKTQYDAFFGTDLEKMLRRKGTTQVVICGVMTHLCCETTARSAFVRGFEVFFAVDGTATYDEQFHRATLLNLAHGFAVPVLTGDILAGFSSDAD